MSILVKNEEMLVYMSLCVYVFSVCVYIHSCLCLLRYISVSLCVHVPFGICACFYLYVCVPVYICFHVYNVCGCACTHVPECICMIDPYCVFLYCSSPYIFQAGSLLNLELTSSASLADQCKPGSLLFIPLLLGLQVHATTFSFHMAALTSGPHLCSESTLSPEAISLEEMLFFVCRGRGAQSL